jgi:large subunit ribosomal protein L21
MYSVVEISGHQYRVKAGDIIDVQKLEDEAGKDITLKNVLFVGGENIAVGAPHVSGASVSAKVIKHDRSRKVIVFKRRPTGWKRKNGHRQHFTALLITEVTDGTGKSEKIDASSLNAKKFLSK